MLLVVVKPFVLFLLVAEGVIGNQGQQDATLGNKQQQDQRAHTVVVE